jgi:lambda family phage portal protein
MSFQDLLDGAISVLSPSWAAQRKLARLALLEADRFVGYREAAPSRLDRTTGARGVSGDYELELGFDRRQIVDRARDLERNNTLAGALLDRSSEFVIGDGFRVQSRSSDKGFRKDAHFAWTDWCENEADARGLDSFDELLDLIYRSWQRDGDHAVLLNRDGSIRLVESDEIASPEGGYYKPSMADGVELDRSGRPKAFWIHNPDPDVLTTDRRVALQQLVRVEAQNVIFLSRRLRSSSTRGLSVFNGMIWLLEQLDGTLEAVTVAHRMAALFALVVKKKSPFSGAIMRTDSGGTARPQLNFEPGSVMRLEPDEDVQQITPAHPGSQSSSHMRDLARLASTRFGIPIELVLGDLTIGNYSNYRTGLVLVRKSRAKKQRKMRNLVAELYRWRTLRAMKAGKLRTRSDGLDLHVVLPGTPLIDPIAEIQAAQAAIDAGFETASNFVAERGHDLDEVLDTREHELEEFARRNIPLTRSTLTRDPIVVSDEPPPAEPKPDTKASDALRGELTRLGEDLAQVVQALEKVRDRVDRASDAPATPPPAPVINITNNPPPQTIEAHSHVAGPDVNVTNNVDAPPATPAPVVNFTANVDVDAEIRGASKSLSVKRNDAGDVTGIDMVAREE